MKKTTPRFNRQYLIPDSAGWRYAYPACKTSPAGKV
ncbi:hypothetical protein EcWSU1_03361 [Enterobacter ludwigii]|uniref:Uncharacterized protein n=1 Tax=Enterobacter ludwigii TaxID=299767 RepID=G8LN99_9ENTR|nr:hypothetical protein EcWSU1_03361 [Enterobacter ludwigii]